MANMTKINLSNYVVVALFLCLCNTTKKTSVSASSGIASDAQTTRTPRHLLNQYQRHNRFQTLAFSNPSGGRGGGRGFSPSSDAVSFFDRFRATCPADLASIYQFDSSLVDLKKDGNDEQPAAWVAVYRSSNNSPSVFVRDEFMNAMQIATSIPTSSPSSSMEGKIESGDNGKQQKQNEEALRPPTPVAVGRIRPSTDFSGQYVIDELRCSLKKEDTNDVCDGGSEHVEALGVCVDELLLHHLRTTTQNDDESNDRNFFDKAIRCKATLVSGILLENRGFQEVLFLSKDMATHVSDLDASMSKYAKRAVSTYSSKNPGARDRALQMLSLLGRLNREHEKEDKSKASSLSGEEKEEGDDEEYDPWANSKIF
uniref:Uncharacterized protein n=1 Tax=Ditylum brightwellii TaxID=49249 RepID=A0A6U3WFS0_9STRA|mmetsp:Transcript_24819/g.36981  ORF Transcript_24819/g.36981 Transcript_24819/m.36981 type:complete len:370 (+) Transcript_24819:202-1311(+)